MSSAFDAVFCDLRMPSTDGPRLVRLGLPGDPRIAERFVFVTGDTLGGPAARFLERAGRPVVEKPFSREAIRQAIGLLGER